MHALRIGLVLGAALLAAACLPVTTKAPVGTTAGVSADPHLIGTWKALPHKEKNGEVDDGGPGFLHILAGKDGVMTVLTVATGKAGDEGAAGEWSVFTAGAASLGKYHYLNVRETFEDGKPAEDKDMRNIPLLYQFGRHGRLHLYLINEDAAKAAVKAGKIEGTVGNGDLGDVVITAAPDKLDAFFASKEGAALFIEKLVTLKRVE